MAQPSTVLLQCASGDHRHLLNLTQSLHAKYCVDHDLDYWCIHDSGALNRLAGRRSAWAKVQLLLEAARAGYTCAIWMDADAFITTDRYLQEACPSKPGIGMTYHDHDWEKLYPNAGLYSHLNTGVIYVRFSGEVCQFIKDWWDTPDDDHVWQDQHALNQLVRYRAQVGKPVIVSRIDQKWNSTIPDFQCDGPPNVMAWHGFGDVSNRHKAMSNVVNYITRLANPPQAMAPYDAIQTAMALCAAQRPLEAVDLLHASIEANPKHAGMLSTLGTIYSDMGDWRSAENMFERADHVEPKNPIILRKHAAALDALGEFDKAKIALGRSIALSGRAPWARYNHALQLLREGYWGAGWKELKWGRVVGTHPIRTLSREWSGRTHAAHAFISAEQGMGDTLMLARFLRALPAEKITLECQAPLVKLLQGANLAPDIEIIEQPLDGNTPESGLSHLHMFELPAAAGIETPDDLRAFDVKYINANPEDVALWKPQFPADRFKVGICWAGSHKHVNDAHRSMPFQHFAPLVDIPGIEVYSLQKDASQPQSHPENIHFLGDELRDFAQTAAVIECLDLVITVDTAVAHLAGAMGKPVWILLSKGSDWRWLRDTSTTNWYPCATLYRQTKLNDWKTLMEEVHANLVSVISDKNSGDVTE